MIQDLALRDLDLWLESVELDEIKAIQLPLKKLSLWNMRHVMETEEKYLALLGCFVVTLEELEIRGHYPDSVYEMIFKKFHKLKVLTININHAPKENTFYHNLRPNPLIQKLFIIGSRETNRQSLEGFIGNMPNLDTLVMETREVSNELLIFVSNNLHKLKTLSMETLWGTTVEDVCIPSLTILSVKETTELKQQDWQLIVKAFPNVVKFSVENVEISAAFELHNFTILTKGWKDLNHLKFGSGFITSKRILNQPLLNCKNFKKIEIPETAFGLKQAQKRQLKHFKIYGVQLTINQEDIIPFVEFRSLWSNEKVVADLYQNEWNEDDDDMMVMQIFDDIAMPLFFRDSDDSEDENYFDGGLFFRDSYDSEDENYFDGEMLNMNYGYPNLD